MIYIIIVHNIEYGLSRFTSEPNYSGTSTERGQQQGRILTTYRYLASQKPLAVLNVFRFLFTPRRHRSFVLVSFRHSNRDKRKNHLCKKKKITCVLHLYLIIS